MSFNITNKQNKKRSSQNGLGTNQSDVDICISTSWNGLRCIKTLAKTLKNSKYPLLPLYATIYIYIYIYQHFYLNRWSSCDTYNPKS